MSKTLLNFIETNKKKGLLFWLNYLITNLNIYKEIPVDNNWKGIKLKSTYYPENMPINAIEEYQFNSYFKDGKKNTAIMEYIGKEYNKQFETFKRYAK